MSRNGSVFRTLIVIGLSLVIAFALEIMVFNFKSIESLFFSQDNFEISQNALKEQDSDKVIIEDLSIETQNIHLIFSGKPKDIIVSITDEGNAYYYDIASLQIQENTENDIYLRINPYGAVTSIKIESPSGEISRDSISLLELNTFEPFDLSTKRVIIAFIVVLMLLLFVRESSLYTASFKETKPVIITLVLLGALVVIGVAYYQFKPLIYEYYPTHHQYHELAVAFSEGHLYLNKEVSADLLQLSNPYDTGARIENNVPFYWDYAFFEGKYYTYFGVLPALLFYLPYYLITGQELQNWIPVAIMVAFFVAGTARLVWVICRRWFKTASCAQFLIGWSILLIGSWIFYALKLPDLYAVPIASALSFLVWGLSFWIQATEGPKIDIKMAIFGSLCLALIAACRPQLLIVACLGVVLIIPYLKHNLKDSLPKIAFAFIPFIVVMFLLGLYNHARFGSPFDFGANYNLTTNDMTHRIYSLNKLPMAYFVYLFQLPIVAMSSPILRGVPLDADYHGALVTEPMYGGLFFLTPVLLTGLLIIRCWNKTNFQKVRALTLICFLAGFILVAFDAEGAGILMRYFCDFGFFFALGALFVYLSLTTNTSFVSKKATLTTEDRQTTTLRKSALEVTRISSSSSYSSLLALLLIISVLIQAIWFIQAPLDGAIIFWN